MYLYSLLQLSLSLFSCHVSPFEVCVVLWTSIPPHCSCFSNQCFHHLIFHMLCWRGLLPGHHHAPVQAPVSIPWCFLVPLISIWLGVSAFAWKLKMFSHMSIPSSFFILCLLRIVHLQNQGSCPNFSHNVLSSVGIGLCDVFFLLGCCCLTIMCDACDVHISLQGPDQNVCWTLKRLWLFFHHIVCILLLYGKVVMMYAYGLTV